MARVKHSCEMRLSEKSEDSAMDGVWLRQSDLGSNPRAAKRSLKWPKFLTLVLSYSGVFCCSFCFCFICGTGVWTQGLHFEPLHQPFFVMGIFEIGSHKLFAWASFKPQSWVARIPGVSHQHLAILLFLHGDGSRRGAERRSLVHKARAVYFTTQQLLPLSENAGLALTYGL
jgi:hypothetical protein